MDISEDKKAFQDKYVEMIKKILCVSGITLGTSTCALIGISGLAPYMNNIMDIGGALEGLSKIISGENQMMQEIMRNSVALNIIEKMTSHILKNKKEFEIMMERNIRDTVGNIYDLKTHNEQISVEASKNETYEERVFGQCVQEQSNKILSRESEKKFGASLDCITGSKDGIMRHSPANLYIRESLKSGIDYEKLSEIEPELSGELKNCSIDGISIDSLKRAYMNPLDIRDNQNRDDLQKLIQDDEKVQKVIKEEEKTYAKEHSKNSFVKFYHKYIGNIFESHEIEDKATAQLRRMIRAEIEYKYSHPIERVEVGKRVREKIDDGIKRFDFIKSTDEKIFEILENNATRVDDRAVKNFINEHNNRARDNQRLRGYERESKSEIKSKNESKSEI